MSQRKVDQYPVFGQWYRTLDWVLDMCDKFPRSVRPTLTQHILQHSIEVMELLTEAIYVKDRAPLLRRVNLRLEQLRILFRLCHQRRYMSDKQYEYIAHEVDTTGRMVGGWLKGPAASQSA